MIKVHVLVNGRVQGVGFRQFVSRMARRYEITGNVKNLPVKDVEINAEGERIQLEKFINELVNGNSRATVDDLQANWQNYMGDFSGFEILC